MTSGCVVTSGNTGSKSGDKFEFGNVGHYHTQAHVQACDEFPSTLCDARVGSCKCTCSQENI